MSDIEMEALSRAWRYGMATDVVRRGPPLLARQASRLRNALSRIVGVRR
jgi:hypothetical protein